MRPAGSPLERVAVALDTRDRATFRRWCALFGGRVGVLKVGLEAFVRWGPAAVEDARAGGASVFLDLKLHDIPKTVAGAVAAAREMGVRYLTVHAGGGETMLRAAAESAAGEVAILAVTLLTHLDGGELVRLDLSGEPGRRVERWTALAAAAGCAGSVCSPLEAAALRRRHPPPFLLATPGIRSTALAAGGGDDQRRTATAAAALAAGADLLVIGRPLTAAPDPEAALAALERELTASPTPRDVRR